MKNNRIINFVGGILVFILYFLILPNFLSAILKKYFSNQGKLVSNITLSIAEILIFLVLFAIYRKTIVEDFKKFKKDYKKKLDVGFKYYFAGFAVMIASNLILALISGGIAANESANREYLKMYPLYSVIAMAIVGPMVEEIVFRLGFRKAFKKWLPYALFSGLFFGGMHVYTAYAGHSFAYILKHWTQALYVIPYGSLGFAFAKAYYDTDNIWTTMTIHMLHNTFTILLIFTIA